MVLLLRPQCPWPLCPLFPVTGLFIPYFLSRPTLWALIQSLALHAVYIQGRCLWLGKGGENLVGFGPGLTRGQISLES